MKKVRKPLAVTMMLLLSMAAAVRGQSALDGFDPNANYLIANTTHTAYETNNSLAADCRR